MIYNQMRMICSLHKKRGEEVQEFNLSPHFYEKMVKKVLIYNDKQIDLVCEGWLKIEKYFYIELKTAQGIIYTTNYIYKLRNDNSIRY